MGACLVSRGSGVLVRVWRDPHGDDEGFYLIPSPMGSRRRCHLPPRPPCPADPMPRFLGTWPVPGFSGVRAATCLRCQTAGFVEAGLSGAGGFRLRLADGLLADVGAVWGPGGFVLGGGDHGRRRCPPKVPGRMTANGAMIRRRCAPRPRTPCPRRLRGRSSRIDSDDDTAHRSSRFAGDDLLSR